AVGVGSRTGSRTVLLYPKRGGRRMGEAPALTTPARQRVSLVRRSSAPLLLGSPLSRSELLPLQPEMHHNAMADRIRTAGERKFIAIPRQGRPPSFPDCNAGAIHPEKRQYRSSTKARG